ncbi:MAG TPA: AraC family transcriptional regulator ligand-binding domain-containing protein [Candidatus Paceibacterota bacterium]|nr:AraC family transcriptional regulator ligand-binding domain-containing protein [Candidatus Paceibacterota bacterium]
MSDRFHLPRAWPQRLAEFKIPLPSLLHRAGLPEIFFQQENIYATTAQVFALWRAVRDMTPDPAIGLKMGEEPRIELCHPATVAAVCSYAADPICCPKCGTTMRIVAFIERHQTEVIEKILRHCGLWDEPSARAPLSAKLSVTG